MDVMSMAMASLVLHFMWHLILRCLWEVLWISNALKVSQYTE